MPETSASDCEDTNEDLRDAYGDGCSYYDEYPDTCGSYDTEHFKANEMCCSCDGGDKLHCENSDDESTDVDGKNCRSCRSMA